MQAMAGVVHTLQAACMANGRVVSEKVSERTGDRSDQRAGSWQGVCSGTALSSWTNTHPCCEQAAWRWGLAQKHTKNSCTVPSHPPLTLNNRSCHGVWWGVGCSGRALWSVSRPLGERRGPSPFFFPEPISVYTKTSAFPYVQRYLVPDMPSHR